MIAAATAILSVLNALLTDNFKFVPNSVAIFTKFYRWKWKKEKSKSGEKKKTKFNLIWENCVI